MTQPNGYDFHNMDPFFRDLGNLQATFLTLEYELRTFLFKESGQPFMKDFDTISEGDFVDKNPFTKWSNLGPLIDEYNTIVKHDPSRVIDRYVVKIRDALAHGRIYRRSVESQPRLLKFSRGDKTEKVRTEFAETLDPATLGKWNLIMSMAIRRVEEAQRSRR